MEKATNYSQHKKILGILYVVFSILNLAFYTGIVTFASAILPFTDAPYEAIMIFGLVKYGLITLLLVFSIPCIIVGIGLINQKNWALTGALILGIVGLPFFPVWTILGVYSIVLFFTIQKDRTYLVSSKK